MYRQIFTSTFIPDATPSQMNWFNELQRVSCSPERAYQIMIANSEIDVCDSLPNVQAPTLVLHSRGDRVAPFDQGRRFAAMIPNSEFVPLESNNHLLLESEPAWSRFLSEVRRFLGVSPDVDSSVAETPVESSPIPTQTRTGLGSDIFISYVEEDSSIDETNIPDFGKPNRPRLGRYGNPTQPDTECASGVNGASPALD
jgi:hypothetical protein